MGPKAVVSRSSFVSDVLPRAVVEKQLTGRCCEVTSARCGRLRASGIYRRLPRTRAPVCARGGGRCRMLSVNEIYNELAGLHDIWGLALLLWDGLQVTRQFLGSLHSSATDLRCSARCMVL